MPGVHAVFSFADLAGDLAQERLPLPVPHRATAAGRHAVLARQGRGRLRRRGRRGGDRATRATLPRTRRALVEVDYEVLPAVSDCRAAIAPGAPLALRRQARATCSSQLEQTYGDVAARLPARRIAPSVNLKQHRGGAHSIEGRGALAAYDVNEDRLTLWSSTQLAHEVRAFLMALLRPRREPGARRGARRRRRLRRQVRDVPGGGGGRRGAPACCGGRSNGSRTGASISSPPCRSATSTGTSRSRSTTTGRLLGVRGHLIHDQGAYTPQGVNLPYNASTALPGPYILPAYELEVLVVETNKVATMPVRGAGYPEGAFAMERLLDRIAGELRLDRAEVRRRNLVPPEKMPYVTPLKTRSGSPIALDSGDFPHCQKLALDSDRLRRISPSASAGRARGPLSRHRPRQRHEGHRARSVRDAASCASAAPAASRSTPARCRWDRASRPRWRRSAPSSSPSSPADVTVIAGDTAVIPYGQGGFASRQTMTAGSAVHLAALTVRGKALKVAAHLLEASVEDLVAARRPRRGRRRAGQRHVAARDRRGGRRACRATPCRAASSPGSRAWRASCRARSPTAWARTRSKSRSTWKRAACASCATSWSTTAAGDQPDDRRGAARRRRGARHRQRAARVDGL